MKPVRKAVFPVAGLGTRFLPATKAVPKEMLTIVDRPLIQYAVEEAREAGIEQMIFVTGRGKGALEDHFDIAYELEATMKARGKSRDALASTRFPAGAIVSVRQQEPLGLGHAVWCAREIVGDEPFAVLLPDDLMVGKPGCLAQMVEAYGKLGGNIICAQDVPRERTASYGIITPGARDGRLTEVKGLVEKPQPEDAPSTLGVVGRYILQPEIMAILADLGKGAGGEIQLTDGLAALIGTQPFHGITFDGARHDCGDKTGFVLANLALALASDDVAPAVRAFLADLDLITAYVAGDGPVRPLSEDEAAAYTGPGFVWVHVEGQDDLAAAVHESDGDIPEVAASALVATETRPRCDAVDHGAILNLRGLGDCPPGDADRLISIRMWIRANRVVSVSRHAMPATGTVRAKMEAGRIHDSGDLVAAYAWAISTQLDPEVAGLGDTLDDVESALEPAQLYRLRRSITAVRSEAISFRRFVAPDRDALHTLPGLGFDWLAEDDRLHIVEAADRFARMAEELEAVRERAALLHEQITDLRAEQIDQRALYISIVAFIFLPLTFITGLFGMNVEGIPYAHSAWSFWGMVIFCTVTGTGVFGWFYWRHWINR